MGRMFLSRQRTMKSRTLEIQRILPKTLKGWRLIGHTASELPIWHSNSGFSQPIAIYFLHHCILFIVCPAIEAGQSLPKYKDTQRLCAWQAGGREKAITNHTKVKLTETFYCLIMK